MGIQGLLPLLKSIEKPVHLKDYSGQTLAVDGYVWLHRGAFACAQELCLGQATEKYVAVALFKCRVLQTTPLRSLTILTLHDPVPDT